jgi:hypothetical protein
MSQAILKSPRAKTASRLTQVVCVDRLHVDRVHDMAKQANIPTEGKTKDQLCKSLVAHWNKKRGRFVRESPSPKKKKSPKKKSPAKKSPKKKSPKRKSRK